MAEDLLRPPKKGETLEEIGCECFDHLASRLFFKQVENDDEKYFVMHDLMHDLATSLAGDLYCRFGKKEEMSILTRHLSFRNSIPKKTCSSNKIESLRTLLYLEDGAGFWKVGATLPCDMLSKNKYLRVLSFDTRNIFPNSIAKKLIQLRYLDLSWSDIVFVVGKQEYNGMEELGGLLNLHGSPEIEKLENVVDANEARSARIIDKKHIEELLLKWSVSSGDDMVLNTHTDEEDILGGLQPHTQWRSFTQTRGAMAPPNFL
ncbi:hypothetical protein AHAS_Ahas12G0022600 [Arachis hypogaea]